MVPLLKKHGLEMRSLYVNSTLHDAAQADKSIEEVLAAAAKAKAVGTRIIVTNPSPIRWGGPENKTDEQLKIQAAALDKLGARLKPMGLILAYHNHDMELRNAAREFHHMMVGTDPANVTLCLDAHWIYRGAGNSQVALFDVLKLYGPRVTELHLRQIRRTACGPRRSGRATSTTASGRFPAPDRHQAAAGPGTGGGSGVPQNDECGGSVPEEHRIHAAGVRRFHCVRVRQIPNPKHQISNKFKIQSSNDPNAMRAMPVLDL